MSRHCIFKPLFYHNNNITLTCNWVKYKWQHYDKKNNSKSVNIQSQQPRPHDIIKEQNKNRVYFNPDTTEQTKDKEIGGCRNAWPDWTGPPLTLLHSAWQWQPSPRCTRPGRTLHWGAEDQRRTGSDTRREEAVQDIQRSALTALVQCQTFCSRRRESERAGSYSN